MFQEHFTRIKTLRLRKSKPSKVVAQTLEPKPLSVESKEFHMDRKSVQTAANTFSRNSTVNLTQPLRKSIDSNRNFLSSKDSTSASAQTPSLYLRKQAKKQSNLHSHFLSTAKFIDKKPGATLLNIQEQGHKTQVGKSFKLGPVSTVKARRRN